MTIHTSVSFNRDSLHNLGSTSYIPGSLLDCCNSPRKTCSFDFQINLALAYCE